MHWLGEVLLHDEICKCTKTLLLAGTSCIDRWGHRIWFSLSWWSIFQTLQQPIIRVVETKAWETPGPHLRCAVKGAELTGCPAPSLPPSQHLSSARRLSPSISEAALWDSTTSSAHVGLTDPNQQLLAKKWQFQPSFKGRQPGKLLLWNVLYLHLVRCATVTILI